MGLLDITDDPQQAGLLSLGLRLMSTPGKFGAALGQAGLGAMGDIRAMQEAAMKKQLQQAQISDVMQQAELRKQQAARMEQAQALLQQTLGASGQPSQYGLAGGGLNMGGVSEPMRPQAGGLAGASPEVIAALKASGIDVSNIWELAKFGKEMQPGYRRNADGTTSYLADPAKGVGYNPATNLVSVMPGAAETQGRLAAANALPKALIDAGTKREDFVQQDGTTRSMSNLQFLEESGGAQTLKRLFGDQGQQPPLPTPQPPPKPAQSRPADSVVPAQAQAQRDADRLEILKAEREKATRPDDRAALDREIARAGGGVVSGIPTQTKLGTEAQGNINSTWLKTSYEPVVQAANVARESAASIKTARFALSGLGDTGFGTGAKESAARVLAAIGVPNAEQFASNGAIFAQAAGSRLFTVLGEQKGTQTEGDAGRARQLFASITIPKQANQYILDLADAKAEWDLRRARYYQEALPYAQKAGDLQEVDRRWQNIAPSVFDMPVMERWKSRLK